MKMYFRSNVAPLLFTLLVASSRVQAAPISSCSTQKSCIEFTYKEVSSGFKCGTTTGIEYEVCAKLNLSMPGCVKGTTDSVSHTCAKSSTSCSSGSVGFAGAKELKSVKNGAVQCQTGKPGESLQFLFKDGSGCSNSVPSAPLLGNGLSGSCEPRTGAVSSCTGNGVGKECVWTVKIPVKAGGGGDPHFRTFDGTKYSYHGECDLIMARSPSFASGLGLDVHIRTEIVGGWSRISNAAILIGSDVLELVNDGSFVYNGNINVVEPIKMAGEYPITTSEEMVEIDGVTGTVKRSFLTIDLKSGNKIRLTVFKKMISIHFNADLLDAHGLMGTRNKIGLIGRDGQTVMGSPNQMGAEWQVNSTEPMLFHEVRSPQYPEECKLPRVESRLLSLSDGEKQRAEELCRDVADEMKQFCIEDVELSGDSELAHNGEAY